MPKLRRPFAVTVVALAVAGVATAAAVARPAAPAAAHNEDHDHLIRPLVSTDADWAPVVAVLGRTGKLAADGTSYRVGLPRRDLSVTSHGVTIPPSFALGGYAAFARYPGGHAMVMGDLVVTEAEAPAVTDALQAGGLQQTAIHKHLLAESPPLWWMHINGMGDPLALARAVKTAVDATATPPPVASPPGTVDLDTTGIDTALGGKGTIDGGVYKFTFARRETISEHGHVIPPGLGVTTALNFQPLGAGQAAINGDFAMTAGEVQHVLAALRRGGITIVSLHNHALDDSPRLFYTHFWATGDAVTVAKALRAALNQTHITR